MPLVSIGMPVYNKPQFLKQAIESLLAQTYRDFELLISDNASTNPEIREICEHYARQDSRVRYVRQPVNLGPMDNFAYVYANTSSPLFMWASDDDIWEPTFVERGVKTLTANPSRGAWICQFDSIDAEGGLINSFPPIVDWESRGNKIRQVLWFMMSQSRGIQVLIYSFFRREAVREPLRIMLENKLMDGPDYIFLHAFICREELVTSPELLFHKRVVPAIRSQRNKSKWGSMERHVVGYSRAALGTPYAAVTILAILPRMLWRTIRKLDRPIRKLRWQPSK